MGIEKNYKDMTTSQLMRELEELIGECPLGYEIVMRLSAFEGIAEAVTDDKTIKIILDNARKQIESI